MTGGGGTGVGVALGVAVGLDVAVAVTVAWAGILTNSNRAEPRTSGAWEVTAMPAIAVATMLMVTLDLGIDTQVHPSWDVCAEKALPERESRR